MIGVYKTQLFDFVRFRGHYELITEFAEKAYEEFTQRSDYYIKVTDFSDPGLTDIFDVDLWIKYDTGMDGLPLEWDVSLDGFTVIKDDQISIDYQGWLPNEENWGLVEKGIWRTFINITEIEGAWITYTYKKKDGVLLEQPVVVREDVSLEKLFELRKYYHNGL